MPTTMRDRYGLDLSTTSDEAARRFVEGVDAVLSLNLGGPESFEAAIAADPDFAIAHAALAGARQLQGRMDDAKPAAARARALAAGATRRERQHVEAMATVIDGDTPRALGLIREHLAEFPRDAALCGRAVSLLFFSGAQSRQQEALALLDGVASAYGEDDWWFLAVHAFACNEMRQHERARRLAERAVALNPASLSGSHALSHVFYETDDHAAGAAFLGPWLDGCNPRTPYYGHLAWHLALFALVQGDADSALRVFDQSLHPAVYPGLPAAGVMDAAALLWRCDLRGIPYRPEHRTEVRDLTTKGMPPAAFYDMHRALALAAAGDIDAVERLAGEIRDRLAANKEPAGEVAAVAVEGIGAFAAGDWQRCARLLAPVAPQFLRIGGSHAQYQVLEDTLIAAYLRAGLPDRAEPLLRARLNRRPSAPATPPAR